MDSKLPIKWMDKYTILSPDDVDELNSDAAINEFGHKHPKHVAEEMAHNEYKRKQLVKAAGFHLAGMKVAHAAGDMKSAQKHHAMYRLAMKSIGADSSDIPTPEVSHAAKTANYSVKFRPHIADQFILEDHK